MSKSIAERKEDGENQGNMWHTAVCSRCESTVLRIHLRVDMMEKREVKRALQSHVGGAMTMSCSQLETFLGVGHAKAVDLLKGLDILELGSVRRYFIPDVAERIMERRTR